MTATYDPGKVLVMFGAIPISGYADGSMVNVQLEGEGVRAETGTAGETAYVESHDRRATVTVRLMETAAAVNTLLSAWFNAGNVEMPLIVTNLSTGRTHASGGAKIKNIPNADRGSDVPVLEWNFVVPVMDML